MAKRVRGRRGREPSYDEGQYEAAIHLMEKGEQKAKTDVAFFKLSGLGGAKIDADGAVVLLEERVKDRDSEAMWMLGICCEYGIGIEKDVERAKLLYERSRKARNAVGKLLKIEDDMDDIFNEARDREAGKMSFGSGLHHIIFYHILR